MVRVTTLETWLLCVYRLMLLETESETHKDLAIFPESSALPESEHLLYQLGWAEDTLSYHYLLRTKDRSVYITSLIEVWVCTLIRRTCDPNILYSTLEYSFQLGHTTTKLRLTVVVVSLSVCVCR